MAYLARFGLGICLAILLLNSAHARLLVASTQPLYLIAQAVTQGIEQPNLLIPAQQDGHHIQIKPQDRRRLEQADFILWIGPEYEAGLSDLLLAKKNAVRLTGLTGLKRLPLRDLNGQPRPNSLDPHLWLEPYNAIFIAHLIAHLRAKQYPQDAEQYLNNASAFTIKMQKMHAAPVGHPKPYWAYHDAYQYLEKTIGLQLAAALTIDPELPPTAQQLQRLRQHRPTAVPCLFTEAHAPHVFTDRLMPVRHVMIDESMRDARDFVTGWQQLRDQMQQCIKQAH